MFVDRIRAVQLCKKAKNSVCTQAYGSMRYWNYVYNMGLFRGFPDRNSKMNPFLL